MWFHLFSLLDELQPSNDLNEYYLLAVTAARSATYSHQQLYYTIDRSTYYIYIVYSGENLEPSPRREQVCLVNTNTNSHKNNSSVFNYHNIHIYITIQLVGF